MIKKTVHRKNHILGYRLFLALLFISIATSAQPRKRWGLQLGIAQFPAWDSGDLFSNQPPHGDAGLHIGPNLLIPLDKKTFWIFSLSGAFHLLHFHVGENALGYFRNSFLNANATYNKEIEVLIRNKNHNIKLFTGFGFNKSNLVNFGNTYRSNNYASIVEPKYLLEPELLAGLGYVIKGNKHLFHINLAYHLSPILGTDFKVYYLNNGQFVHHNHYQYLLVSINAFPKFGKRKRIRQKWSLCR